MNFQIGKTDTNLLDYQNDDYVEKKKKGKSIKKQLKERMKIPGDYKRKREDSKEEEDEDQKEKEKEKEENKK